MCINFLSLSCQTVKTKEEKEVLEHFAGMVCDVCPLNYVNILSKFVLL